MFLDTLLDLIQEWYEQVAEQLEMRFMSICYDSGLVDQAVEQCDPYVRSVLRSIAISGSDRYTEDCYDAVERLAEEDKNFADLVELAASINSVQALGDCILCRWF